MRIVQNVHHARLRGKSRQATRRLDQLRQAQKETVGLNTGAMGIGTAVVRVDEKPTLASQGIDKNLAHQARTRGAPANCSSRLSRTGSPRRWRNSPRRQATLPVKWIDDVFAGMLGNELAK
jgi:hypothetical protein